MTIALLLLGKTGVGKSVTGNSILGHKAFEFGGTTSSVTFCSKKDICEWNGRTFEVVDTPGVADTGYSVEEGKKMFMGAITQAIAMSPYGYHALIYTLKYGNRLTKEDVDVFMYLKQQFGDTFLMQHGIVVMTGGDQFGDDHGKTSFLQWCQQQSGHFQSILREVNGRVVLFDNNRRCPQDEKVAQRQAIVDLVHSVGQTPYTSDDFQKAQEAYRNYFTSVDALTDGVRNECSLILGEYWKIVNDKKSTSSANSQSLRQLEARLHNLKAQIREERSTSVAAQLNQLVDETLASVSRGSSVSPQDVQCLQSKFNTIRDKSNNNLFGKIFSVIKWVVSAIIKWLPVILF